jgi:arylsulfatase A-like enzyme
MPLNKIACTLIAILFVASIQAQQPTNVLILLSDDQSHNTIRALGNKEIYTPNLDRLVSEGFTFTQVHVMGGHQGAICIPSRAMLLTGRYVNRLPGDGSIISDTLVAVPEVLQTKGYNTFHTGKWHNDKKSHNRMFKLGGNIFFGGMHFERDGGQENPTVYGYDQTGDYSATAMVKKSTYSSSLYAETAIGFLNSPHSKSKPFLCYVAFTSPHDPRTPPEKFRAMYDAGKISIPPNYLPEHPFNNGDLRVRDELLLPHPRDQQDVKREIALYYGMVSEMDEQVGKIIEALKKNGLLENTLIIFAGDNGLAVGQHGLLGKQNLYEHSIRVPLIFSGPGIPKNKKSDAFVYLSDIAPTIYEYLGLGEPATVEGRSLLPVIKGGKPSVRNSIYNVYGHWSRSLKTEDGFKLILYNVNGEVRTQLFNLKDDPWEINNLASKKSYQQKIGTMRSILKMEMTLANDDLNIDLPNWGRSATQKGAGS